jgi:hypothetical protein
VSHLSVSQRVKAVIGKEWILVNPRALLESTTLCLSGSDANLVRPLEDEFSISISFEALSDVRNLADLIGLVEHHTRPQIETEQ